MTRSILVGAQTFAVEITPVTLKRVRALTQIRLEEVIDLTRTPPLVEELTRDVVLFVDVLYAVLKPQCDALGWDSARFGEALASHPQLQRAMVELLYAVEDFFHPGRTVAPLRTVVAKALEYQDRIQAMGPELTSRIDQAATAYVESQLAKLQATKYGDSSGTTPESSESSQTIGA